MSGSARFQTLTVLPVLPGDTSGRIAALSTGAAAAVGRSASAGNVTTAARWVGRTIQQLPYGSDGPLGNVVAAYCVSADGTIVGGQVSIGGSQVGCTWLGGGAGGEVVVEQPPFGSDGGSLVYACNTAATLLAGISGTSGASWTGGVATDLPALPGGAGAGTSQVLGMSPDGTALVGNSFNAAGTTRAVKWVSGVVTDLGTILAADSAQAYGASTNGAVIVGWDQQVDGDQCAAAWAPGVYMLPSIKGGGFLAQALGVSNDGTVIAGFCDDAAHHVAPVCWISGVLVRLPSLGFATGGSSFGFGQAVCVSPDGVAIGGWVANSAGALQPCIWT